MKHQPETPERRLGTRVRQLRETAGWSQADFGQRLGAFDFPMHQTTVAKLEAGSRPVRVDEAVAIATLFGVPLGDLIEVDPNQARSELDEALVEAKRREFAYLAAVEAHARNHERLALATTAYRDSEIQVAALDAHRKEADEHYLELLARNEEEL